MQVPHYRDTVFCRSSWREVEARLRDAATWCSCEVMQPCVGNISVIALMIAEASSGGGAGDEARGRGARCVKEDYDSSRSVEECFSVLDTDAVVRCG